MQRSVAEAGGMILRGSWGGLGFVLAVDEHLDVVNRCQHQDEDAAEKANGEQAFQNVNSDCDPKIHGCCPTGRLFLLKKVGSKDGVRKV